jgi:hypothetical protein
MSSLFFINNQDRKIPELNEDVTISKTGESQVTLTFNANEKCTVIVYRNGVSGVNQTLSPDTSTNVVLNSIPDGVYQFSYLLRDPELNEKTATNIGSPITIDTTGAVLTLNAYGGSTSPLYVEKFATSYNDPGVTAIDAVDGDISGSVTTAWVGSTIDLDVTGTYTLRYTSTDSGGFSNTIDRSYIVRDTIDPQVTIDSITTSSNDVTINFSSLSEPDVTCNVYQESAHTNLLVSFLQASNAGTFSKTFTDSRGPGTYTYYIQLTDPSGNETDVTTSSVTISGSPNIPSTNAFFAIYGTSASGLQIPSTSDRSTNQMASVPTYSGEATDIANINSNYSYNSSDGTWEIQNSPGIQTNLQLTPDSPGVQSLRPFRQVITFKTPSSFTGYNHRFATFYDRSFQQSQLDLSGSTLTLSTPHASAGGATATHTLSADTETVVELYFDLISGSARLYLIVDGVTKTPYLVLPYSLYGMSGLFLQFLDGFRYRKIECFD